jgi:exosortase A-associated hydrolase 1
MSFEERAIVLDCRGARLPAIVSLPEAPVRRGVLVVVGGPQYRAGRHRQFTLLCRALADRGIAAMRFDYRGMGDAEGDARTFESVDDDIRAAIDAFLAQVPPLKEVVIWGLCDAASAASFYAHADARVCGIVLLNPWVRDATTMARAQLRHYYWSRIGDRELWRRILHGDFNAVASMRSFAAIVRDSMRRRRPPRGSTGPVGSDACPTAGSPLAERMADRLGRFEGKVLLILSGRDLTASEFSDVVAGSRHWRRLLSVARVETRTLPEADHTFSKREWRDQVADWTTAWVQSW